MFPKKKQLNRVQRSFDETKSQQIPNKLTPYTWALSAAASVTTSVIARFNNAEDA